MDMSALRRIDPSACVRRSLGLLATALVVGVAALPLAAPLQNLTGPIDIALNPVGTKLYAANNGKAANWYSVTIYDIDPSGAPSATAAHIGGDKTGLCNPASVAVDPAGSHLYVANREGSGGSLTVCNLDAATGSLKVPAGAPADFNVQPDAMMLHDTLNRHLAGCSMYAFSPTLIWRPLIYTPAVPRDTSARNGPPSAKPAIICPAMGSPSRPQAPEIGSYQ